MTTTFCPGCGTEYEAGVVVCPECGAMVDTDDALVYEMDGWEEGERTALDQLLTAEGIAHKWEGDDLLVPEDAEDRVDGLMDRVEFPDALEAIGAEEDDDVDDEAVYAVMSNLFVAADRLADGDMVDVELAGEFVVASAAAGETPPPYGVDPGTWKDIQQRAQGIVTAIEAEADDEAVVKDATLLREVLRRFV